MRVLQQQGCQSSFALLPVVGPSWIPPYLAASALERPVNTFERFLRDRPHLFCVFHGNSVALAPGQQCAIRHASLQHATGGFRV